MFFSLLQSSYNDIKTDHLCTQFNTKFHQESQISLLADQMTKMTKLTPIYLIYNSNAKVTKAIKYHLNDQISPRIKDQ